MRSFRSLSRRSSTRSRGSSYRGHSQSIDVQASEGGEGGCPCSPSDKLHSSLAGDGHGYSDRSRFSDN